MKVREWMTQPVETCSPEANLAEAAMIMWRNDCGVVPVVDGGRRAIGIITDRDICMAVATRHVPAGEIGVADVMSRQVDTVRADDDVETALNVMRRDRVRRVPVVAKDGSLKGILSLNDLALNAGPQLPPERVLSALKDICQHRSEHAHA